MSIRDQPKDIRSTLGLSFHPGILPQGNDRHEENYSSCRRAAGRPETEPLAGTGRRPPGELSPKNNIGSLSEAIMWAGDPENLGRRPSSGELR
jgi:hypothetical protein